MKHKKIRDEYGLLDHLETSQGRHSFLSLPKAAAKGLINVKSMPYSLQVLFEGVVRNFNGNEIDASHVAAFASYDPARPVDLEIPFMPARVLLQDFTGVPCVVDLAAMRSAMARAGKDPKKINPQLPVNLVIDHSLNTDHFNSPDAMRLNTELEFQRNRERYEFLRWGQSNLENFTVVPPASGICHQVNLEYLARTVQKAPVEDGSQVLYFDTLVGTDSHTTMINGLGVLGWGVGGIEAEAAMLGQPIYMLLPPVVGVRLKGQTRPGVTATDIVLRVTEMLRKHGVVNKIVEFFGTGIAGMSVPDRATIANMAPEYGATAGIFPVDSRTMEYLHQTGREVALIEQAEAYFKAQGLFWTPETPEATYEAVLELDLSTVKPALSGPKRPQDRLDLDQTAATFREALVAPVDKRGFGLAPADLGKTADAVNESGLPVTLSHGSVVISSITSCTNTSSPSLLLGAGILARKAVEKGLSRKPWVKTSFAPGSRVVTDYLEAAGLMEPLAKLGFHLVGYGCATCIGNSGPLPEDISRAIEEHKIVAAAVLSGNRNFEGRVNPNTRANYLASPPLCVAYAIAGNMDVDLATQPLGTDPSGSPVYLRDIWPSDGEIRESLSLALDRNRFMASYHDVENSNPQWNALGSTNSPVFAWDNSSTYIQEPPFFRNLSEGEQPVASVSGARVLAMFGDSITTDHISPAGSIATKSPAGSYLQELGVDRKDFNSYGSRRGNDRIMARGTFANIRIRNMLVPGTEGGVTRNHLDGQTMPIYDAAMAYQAAGVPAIILAGKDYGMGSSRDWAAKGVMLLGVKAVIAESFERIHRSNLIGMGVLPLQFRAGENAAVLGLDGTETYAIPLNDAVQPKSLVEVTATHPSGKTLRFSVVVRMDSSVEISYYRNGGILHRVLKGFLKD